MDFLLFLQTIGQGPVAPAPMETGPDWTDIITAAIAVYAAVISTIEMVMRLRSKKPAIRVTATFGFMQRTDGTFTDRAVILDVANAGESAVDINVPYFKLGKDETLLAIEPNSTVLRLPHTLQPGKSCQFWYYLTEMRTGLVGGGKTGPVKLTPAIKDAVGNEYTGAAIKLDPMQF